MKLSVHYCPGKARRPAVSDFTKITRRHLQESVGSGDLNLNINDRNLMKKIIQYRMEIKCINLDHDECNLIDCVWHVKWLYLTHLLLVPYICVSKLGYHSVKWVIIGSGKGLSPVWRQAVTWTNADILSARLLGTNLSEILIGILSFSSRKMHL